MESRPVMASVESLQSTLVASSLASSRASSRSPVRLTAKRKFSIVARMRSISDMSSERERRTRKTQLPTDAELAQMMGKISNIQVTGDGKTFRERAKKQLETIEVEHVHQVLEEYTRIPHTLLPLEMLSVPLVTRIRVRESVAKAKAALVAKVNEQNDVEDRQDAAQRAERKRSVIGRKHIPRQESCSGSARTSCLPDLKAPLELSADCQSQSGASGGKGCTALISDQSTMVHSSGFASAEAFARICKETGISAATAPITSAVLEALTPPSSRAAATQQSRPSNESSTDQSMVIGGKHPSKSNPFASFLTERSDAEAEHLPNELMLCYFAHNQVQDRLRSVWRQKQKSCSAEQVAREVWEQLPQKYFPVSTEFEGQLAKKALRMDEMVYVWVCKFWERCKNEGW